MNIVGPIAIAQAKKVVGLKIDDIEHIEITGSMKDILSGLVKQYEQLFGRASIEACKDALKESQVNISSKDLPLILQ